MQVFYTWFIQHDDVATKAVIIEKNITLGLTFEGFRTLVFYQGWFEYTFSHDVFFRERGETDFGKKAQEQSIFVKNSSKTFKELQPFIWNAKL